jgi:hypothetical protein
MLAESASSLRPSANVSAERLNSKPIIGRIFGNGVLPARAAQLVGIQAGATNTIPEPAKQV